MAIVGWARVRQKNAAIVVIEHHDETATLLSKGSFETNSATQSKRSCRSAKDKGCLEVQPNVDTFRYLLIFSPSGAHLPRALSTSLSSKTKLLHQATKATKTCLMPNQQSSMLAFLSAPDAGERNTLHRRRGYKHVFTAAEPRTDQGGRYLICKCDNHDYKSSQWMHMNWPCNED
jgi:hypothetical protein